MLTSPGLSPSQGFPLRHLRPAKWPALNPRRQTTPAYPIPSHPEWATASATRKTNSATLALAHGHAHASANASTAASAAVPAACGNCPEKPTSELSTGPQKIGISNLADYFEGSADSGAIVIGANAAGGQLGPGSASEEVCPTLAGTKTIASKVVGTCIRICLIIKTPTMPARSTGSAFPAYRKVRQKGMSRSGA